MKLFQILLTVVSVSLLATSCATFPKNSLPKVSASASSGKKVSLTYTITSAQKVTHQQTDGTAAQNAEYAKQLTAAAEKSGRFSSVTEGKGGAVHVNVHVLNHANGMAAAASGFISGLTFTAIPAVASDNYTLAAKARASSGKTRQYVLEDGTTTVIWLPMIFAMPTNHPAKVIPKVQENIFANLIQQMNKDGFLSGN